MRWTDCGMSGLWGRDFIYLMHGDPSSYWSSGILYGCFSFLIKRKGNPDSWTGLKKNMLCSHINLCKKQNKKQKRCRSVIYPEFQSVQGIVAPWNWTRFSFLLHTHSFALSWSKQVTFPSSFKLLYIVPYQEVSLHAFYRQSLVEKTFRICCTNILGLKWQLLL